MTPKHPVFQQHWHEFTVEHPEMLSRSRYVLESDREEPMLSVDVIGFLHFVRWARQKGYGPAGVSGLIPWVQQTYRSLEQERREPDGSQGWPPPGVTKHAETSPGDWQTSPVTWAQRASQAMLQRSGIIARLRLDGPIDLPMQGTHGIVAMLLTAWIQALAAIAGTLMQVSWHVALGILGC
jgi:hypothetical protein